MATERVRQPYKQREMARAAKYLATLVKLNKVAEASGWKQNQLDMIAEAGKAVTKLQEKLLSTLPDDFEAPAQARGNAFEEGDEVEVKEQYASIYGTKKNEVMTVSEVARVGGADDGRGAKIFLRLERKDGSMIAVQASHCE